MKTKILFAFVILATLCCCSSDSTVESHNLGLTVNANGKMLSETYQKLNALLGDNSEDSLAVFQTRANLTTNSDFEELDDEQLEAKAQEIFSPYVQDGITIRDEVISYASSGSLNVSSEDLQKFENLDEVSLAGMAYYMSILTVVEKQEPLTIDGEPLTLTTDAVINCLSLSLGLDVIDGIGSYISGTWGIITASTALKLGLGFLERTYGWITLAHCTYQFVKCIKKTGCVYSIQCPDSLIHPDQIKTDDDINMEP
jgi:hypothetical protein